MTDTFHTDIAAFEQTLADQGIHGALRFLNQRAPHRFTGIYRLDPPLLRSVQLFDRENPALEVGADAPLRETYCSITGSCALPFATPDSRADERLREHPARDSTLSYCGVPLVEGEGEAFGTLCHFDVVPHPVPYGEIAFLEAAALPLMRALRGAGRSAIE